MKTPTAPSGYLSGLVDRVLPREPALQRRQPALFEPERPWAGSMAQEASEEAEPRPTAARPPEREVAPSTASTPRREEAAPRGPVAAARAAPVASVETRRAGDAPSRPPLQAQKVDASIRVVKGEASARPAETTASRFAPPLPTGASTPVVSAASLAPPTTRVEPTPTTTPRLDAPGRVVQALEETAPPRPARDATVTAQPAPAPPRARAPVPARAAARAAALASTRQPEPMATPDLPPVQVTIGRVEVRAVSAPPAAERSRRAAPRLSLEQYLHERNGGRR